MVISWTKLNVKFTKVRVNFNFIFQMVKLRSSDLQIEYMQIIYTKELKKKSDVFGQKNN